MRVASLFSGIGGFEIGLGHEYLPILLNDNDPDAAAVLARHFPGVPYVDDVACLRAGDLAEPDLVVGGFPCQDVSIVGGQMGMGGSQTSLVEHLFRLSGQTRPATILLENVQSIRFVHGGRTLAYLMAQAERLGYAWAYRTLDSRGFGLAQRRRRFYFLASRAIDPGAVLFADPGIPRPAEKPDLRRPIGFYWTEGRAGHGLTDDAVPPIKSGSGLGIASPPAVLMPNGAVMVPTIETAERLQGFPAGWTEAASPRARWRLVGNAVSPPVLRWIGEHLASPRAWQLERLTSPMPTYGTWPLAAWGDGRGQRLQVEALEYPSDAIPGRLSHEEFDWTPISRRALAGFVARARSSRLRYPDGFVERLEAFLSGLR